ncbi:MAG TPA: hypothetical protein VI758_11550, partial [Bacteroidota bacterium]
MFQIDFSALMAYIQYSQMPQMLTEKLRLVQNRIAAACERSGRAPGEVLLVAVTKTFGVDVIRSAYEAGQM